MHTTPIGLDPRLEQALLRPAEAATRTSPRSGVFENSSSWLTLLDAAQIALIGPVLVTSGTSPPLQIAKMLVLGLLVSSLALIIRSGLRFAFTPTELIRAGLEPVVRPALTATVGTAAAFGLLGLSIWLLEVAQTLLPVSFYWWGCVSICLTALIHLAIFLTQSDRQRYIVAFGPRQQTEAYVRDLVARRCAHATVVSDDEDDALGRIERLLVAGKARVVVLTHPITDRERIAEICRRLSDMDVRVCRSLSADSLGIEAVAAQSHVLVDLLPLPLSAWQLPIKRTFDITVSIAALVLLAPAFVFAAIAIKIESPGPILFRQWRFGLGGHPTRVYKFRTMRADLGDSTGAHRTLTRDPRVTRVGRILRRTSFDEAPQFLNVILGEMSVVGPRPHPTHMMVEGSFYFDAVSQYRTRHRVKPGITGWAQINGSRGEVDTLAKARRRVELDLWYLSNWSPALDVRIVLRTAFGGFATFGAD